ncbi:MarR family transcriptional regulator [Nocardia sp. NBC_01499]|uniref:MarR family winged helix-turn-helix transcriptional regulator n=1 Tax=Nocardia sp. NBC_01499 TaxID=2903597 RepID=UPI00386B47F6
MDEPRALTADERPMLTTDERQIWKKLAILMFQVPAAVETQLQQNAGMSHFEYAALHLLAQAPGHKLQVSALADAARASRPRVSQGMTRLERRGWVRRQPSPHDSRATLIVLTDAGRAQLAEATPGYHETVRALVLSGLDNTDVQHLEAVCDLLLSNLETYQAVTGPA